MDAPTTAQRRLGCLLGGAIGDALGAPIEFDSLADIRARFGPDGLTDYAVAYGREGAITDDTQMTLFTAEGLIRAERRMRDRGICNPYAVVWRAYGRWLVTQGEEFTDVDFPNDGYLLDQQVLHARRAPGNTCLAALRGGSFGSPDHRINESKGCGGVMRVAPVGFFGRDPFELASGIAALTHGHPSGFLAAGAFALLIARVAEGAALDAALDDALESLARFVESGEVSIALRRARVAAAHDSAPRAESIEELGGGWVAEEALAIAVYCALTARDFASGVLAAVNHSGDSDSTGSMTGNLLGAMLGAAALPASWVERVEARDVIERISADLGYALESWSGPSAPEAGEDPSSFFDRYPTY